ncbi:MAG: GNAT family N-acetyltransferase [bacterium]
MGTIPVLAGEITVEHATPSDIQKILPLLRHERGVLPFLPASAIERYINNGEVLVAKDVGATSRSPVLEILGLVHYHHRKDSITTLQEIVVAEAYRGQGLGKRLVEALLTECSALRQKAVRLKCPVVLPANGFYNHLGFQRVAVESGKRSPLAIWEKPLHVPRIMHRAPPAFFATLTNHTKAVGDITRLWDESGDKRNPFAHVVFTPLFSPPTTIAFIHQLKDERGSVVMFDSGGYQVQMGKATYEELFDRLLRFYRENGWADWYVLPDHVPRSTDSDREVDFKVQETLDFTRLFLHNMPDGFAEKAIGVVHGRTEEQIRRCVEAYDGMGVRYLGFGSFGTSGPNGAVNMVSQKSLRLLRLVQTLAEERGGELHIFGIGSPSHLIRLADAGITPTSFDSAGWWKAGGFGKVFFPAGRQLHITRVDGHNATQRGIEREKQRSQHDCPFCADVSQLRRRRIMRVMHNLAAMLDTTERVSRL